MKKRFRTKHARPKHMFNAWRVRAEKYLATGREKMKVIMDWAVTKLKKIDIDEIDNSSLGKKVHEHIILKHPDIDEFDEVLYEELVSMLDGNAFQIYIELNTKKSGLEAWRMLNACNDPKTFQQSEVYLERKDALVGDRCTTA